MDYDLRVETHLDGTVEAVFSGTTATAVGALGRLHLQSDPPGACNDDAYNFENSAPGRHIKWYSEFDWYYKDNSGPDDIAQWKLVNALQDATTNITHVNNNCGLSDTVNATSNYQGTTNSSVNMPNGTHNCDSYGDRDGVSTTAFGDVGGGYIGWTCYWYDAHSDKDKVVEADTRLDKANTSWYTPGTTECSHDYSVEAVGTHERGHAFGLAHVSEADHGNLTMSPDINGTCENTEASLGLGDVDGLKALY